MQRAKGNARVARGVRLQRTVFQAFVRFPGRHALARASRGAALLTRNTPAKSASASGHVWAGDSLAKGHLSQRYLLNKPVI